MEIIFYILKLFLFIISIGFLIILSINISKILESKGYSTSFWSNPTEIIDFISIIRKEADSRHKRDYKVILTVYFFSFILTFLSAIILF